MHSRVVYFFVSVNMRKTRKVLKTKSSCTTEKRKKLGKKKM